MIVCSHSKVHSTSLPTWASSPQATSDVVPVLSPQDNFAMTFQARLARG